MKSHKLATMDPQQTAVYAKAHDDLRDLFREIARHGRVTCDELQHSLLPFTAGDAKRDLQDLIDDMKRKQTSLDEPEFIRALWKKMYLANVIYTTQHTGAIARPASAGSRKGDSDMAAQAINIPLAHVIVSIKRRAQLKQFANYYASRGISGADHLSAGTDPQRTDRSTPRHVVQGQLKRQAAAAAAAQAATVTALRARTSATQDVIVCSYDGEALCMKAHRMFSNVEMATVATCSRFHCVVSTKATGAILVGSRPFLDRVRQRARQLSDDDWGTESPTRVNLSKLSLDASITKDLDLVPFDDLGLRNTVAFGAGGGFVVATTGRRVHCWKAFEPRATASLEMASATSKVNSPEKTKPSEQRMPLEAIEFFEDEGDSFGHVPLLKRVKSIWDVGGIHQIVCGDRFAIGVTTTSDLYAWGTAPLGRGKAVPTRLSLADMNNPISVSRIACGLQHVLVLTTHGSVFAWGSNVHGQLGLSPHGSALDAAVTEPTEVSLSSVALDIACGDHHSIALTDKGGIFAWGNNWHGQLGLDPSGSETGCVFAPTKINWWTHHADAPSSPERRGRGSPSKTALSRVYLIAASGDTTAIVTEHSHVYCWGKVVRSGAIAGVCGVAAHWTPQRLDVLDDVEASDGDSADIARSSVSSWSCIAIASGLALLTTHVS